MLRITEIFHSLQGESTRAGFPCVFIRLTACDLRCTYCDTDYAFVGGQDMSLEKIQAAVDCFPNALVEITGGEPLLQPNVHPLMEQLLNRGRTVMLETSGAQDISVCDPRVIRIVDIKCPSSGENHRNRWENLNELRTTDEVKFVIGHRDDFDWARNIVKQHDLSSRCPVLFSAVWNRLELRNLAEWIRDTQSPVRLQPQLHKMLWGSTPST